MGKSVVSMKEAGFGIVLFSFYFLPSTSSTKLKVVALTNLSQQVSNYASSNSQLATGARREHARTPQRGVFRAGFYLVLTALTGPPCHSRGLSIAHFLDSRNNQNWRLGARCQRSSPAAHLRSSSRGAGPLHGQQSCSDTLELCVDGT